MKSFLLKLIKSHNFLSLLGNGSAAVLGFINFAILARTLDKAGLGNWMIFMTLATIFELLRTGFLHTPLIKFVSGKSEEESRVVTGTSWLFGIMLTLSIGLVSYSGYLFAGIYIENQGFLLFLKWMWLLSILSLPFNYAMWNLQTDLRFDKLLYVRLISLVSFLLLLLLNLLLNYGITYILYAYLFSTLLTSVISIIIGWSRINTMLHASKARMKELFDFGKYSMGTMIGANLLRSSDTLLIGIFLGPQAVALYSVPQKLFEVIEIPLRSFVATALPNLSRLVNDNDMPGLRDLYEKNAGSITFLLLPLVLVCFVFAEPMVVLLGGYQYLESANILRIFAVFAAIMPLDRYSGITLDVINKPKMNFRKVMVMLIVNVIGDLLVIKTWGLLWPVAVVSVFTFSSGLVYGNFLLKRYLDFSVKNVLISGYFESRLFLGNVISKFKPSNN
jgi:O-antigen/teichoic acid export membrane protein